MIEFAHLLPGFKKGKGCANFIQNFISSASFHDLSWLYQSMLYRDFKRRGHEPSQNSEVGWVRRIGTWCNVQRELENKEDLFVWKQKILAKHGFPFTHPHLQDERWQRHFNMVCFFNEHLRGNAGAHRGIVYGVEDFQMPHQLKAWLWTQNYYNDNGWFEKDMIGKDRKAKLAEKGLLRPAPGSQ